jgi:hypothetical protein
MTYEQVQAKIAEKERAKILAKEIVEISADLKAMVDTQAAGVIVEEFNRIIDIIHAVKQAIEASPEKNPRAMILKLLGGMHNRLSIISAGYAAGSLPKAKP